MFNGKSLAWQRPTAPTSDPEICKEDDRAPWKLHLDHGNANHLERLPQGCVSHQNPAQTVDKQDSESSLPPLPRQSKVSPHHISPPQEKPLIYWVWWLKTDAVLVLLPLMPMRPGAWYDHLGNGLVSVILIDTQDIWIILSTVIYPPWSLVVLTARLTMSLSA